MAETRLLVRVRRKTEKTEEAEESDPSKPSSIQQSQIPKSVHALQPELNNFITFLIRIVLTIHNKHSLHFSVGNWKKRCFSVRHKSMFYFDVGKCTIL